MELLFGGSDGLKAPQGLTLSYDFGMERIHAQWDPVSGAEEYQLYSSFNESDWTPTELRSSGTSDDILAPRADFGGMRVYIKVAAVDEEGELGPLSPSQWVDIPLPDGPPPAPTGFEAWVDWSASPPHYSFSWDPATGATMYSVTYAWHDQATWYDFTSTGGTSITMPLESQDYNNIRDFRVTASNDFGESAPSMVVVVPVPPAELAFINAVWNGGTGSVDLSWNPVPDASGYYLYRAIEPDEPSVVTDQLAETAFSYVPNDGELGKPLTFMVTAVLSGLESVPSGRATVDIPESIGYAQMADGWYRFSTVDDSLINSIAWSDPVNFVSNDPPTTGVHTTLIEAQVRREAGSIYGGQGVIFGYVDESDYQVLLINANGQHTIWDWNASWTTLKDWTNSGWLYTGLGSSNDILVTYDYEATPYDQGTINIFFNGTHVDSISPPPGTYSAKVGFVTEISSDDSPSTDPVSVFFNRLWPE